MQTKPPGKNEKLNDNHKKQWFKILQGDAYEVLPTLQDNSIDCIFTSPDPPFNYREMDRLKAIMLLAERLVKPTGSIWVQLGDYHSTEGDMALIPERFVTSMVIDYGWHLRSKLIWYRPTDDDDEQPADPTRFTRDWEYLYWFVKQNPGYYFDKECMIDYGSVFQCKYIKPNPHEFRSGFPEELIETAVCITCPDDGIVLDPFTGTGTTGAVALECHANFIGIEQKAELIAAIILRLEEGD